MSGSGSQPPISTQPVGGYAPPGAFPPVPQYSGPMPSGGGFFDPRTGQVGGGAAIPVGNQFSNWLGSALGTPAGGPGQVQNIAQNIQNMMSGRPGDPRSLGNYFNAGLGQNGSAANLGQSTAQFNPQQIQAPGGFGNVQGGFAVQQAPSQYTAPQFQGAGMQGPQQVNAQQISGQYNSPQFQQAALQGVNTQFNPGQVQQVNGQAQLNAINQQYNAPQFQQAPLQNVNTQFNPQSIQQVQAQNLQFNGANRPNVLQGVGTQAQLGNVVNPAANGTAMQALMDRQRTVDVANLRERFGNQALGTSAQFAESQYLAEAAPRQALAMDEINRQNNAMALTQRGQDLQNFQGSRGLDVQQLGMGGDQSLQAAQMANNFALQNAQLQQQGQIANQQGSIEGMRAQLQAMGMSNEAILGMNAQQLQQATQMNQMNQSNAQFGAQLGQQNQQLNNQFALQGAQLNQQGQIANQGASVAQMQAQLQAMGMSNEAILGMNAQQLQQATQQNQFNQGNSQFGAQFGQQAGQLNNQFGLQAAGLNNDAMNQFNQLMLQQTGQQNQFNQGNAQFGAQFGQQAAQQNNAANQANAALGLQGQIANQNAAIQGSQMGLQAGQLNNQFALNAAQMNQGNQQFNSQQQLANQQLMNQWNLGLQNIGQNREGTQAQSQQAALGMLMQALGNTQRIGTPQAENTVEPSTASQWINGIGAIAGAGAGIYGAWQAGRGGGGYGGNSVSAPPPVGFPVGGNGGPNGNMMMGNLSLAPGGGSPGVPGGQVPPQLPGWPQGPQSFAPQQGNFANGGFGGGYIPQPMQYADWSAPQGQQFWQPDGRSGLGSRFGRRRNG